GIPRDESEAVLAYLYQHAENPLFQCRFRWTENAIAFWDNRCTQHRAMWDYWPHTRAGTRVTVKGERPVANGSGSGHVYGLEMRPVAAGPDGERGSNSNHCGALLRAMTARSVSIPVS